MSDQERPWFVEWFEPSGFQTHLCEDLRQARKMADQIRGRGQPIGIRPKPPRRGDPPVVLGEPFRTAFPRKANRTRKGGRTMAPMSDHPFIAELKISAAGDVRYCGRELQPRTALRPISDAAPERSHPWLIRLEDPPPTLRSPLPDDALPVVNLTMATVPLAVLIEETHGGLEGTPIEIRAAAWAMLLESTGVLADDSSTPLPNSDSSP